MACAAKARMRELLSISHLRRIAFTFESENAIINYSKLNSTRKWSGWPCISCVYYTTLVRKQTCLQSNDTHEHRRK